MDIGKFPRPPHNAPDEIVNYDQRVPVEGGAFLAWGHLTYTKPLTEKAAVDYELRPSPDNPDMQRRTYELAQLKEARPTDRKPPIAEQLKKAGRLAQKNRGAPAPKKDAPDHGDR